MGETFPDPSLGFWSKRLIWNINKTTTDVGLQEVQHSIAINETKTDVGLQEVQHSIAINETKTGVELKEVQHSIAINETNSVGLKEEI